MFGASSKWDIYKTKIGTGFNCQGMCRGRLLLVTQQPQETCPQASTLDANEPVHLSEDYDTAGYQLDLMQWVSVSDVAGDAS